MHRMILIFIAAFSASVSADDQSFKVAPLIAPEPIIDFIDLGRSGTPRQAPNIYPEFVCGTMFLKPEFNLSNSQLVMEFVGTRETWIPINGKAEKEYVFRVK